MPPETPRLAVAFVALAGFAFGLGLAAAVGGEGAADVVAFLELAFGVAADIAFVGAGVDQFALRCFALGLFLRGFILGTFSWRLSFWRLSSSRLSFWPCLVLRVEWGKVKCSL